MLLSVSFCSAFELLQYNNMTVELLSNALPEHKFIKELTEDTQLVHRLQTAGRIPVHSGPDEVRAKSDKSFTRW